MPRPSWLERAEESAVELISARGGPRGGRRRGEYFELEDLDDEGNQADTQYEAPAIPKREMNKAIFIPFIVAIILILIIGFAGTEKKPEKFGLISNGTHEYYPTTILLSLDGLNPHYISPDRTPNLDVMAKKYTAAPYMTPVFPSQTFPNHWTLITGLYPCEHGIVGNSFYDPKLDKLFQHTNEDSIYERDFWGGEPIWTTAKKQGRITAVHMWPGSEANWRPDEAPDFVDEFNLTESLDTKADRIMEWLDMDVKERPQLILSYVPTVDTAGHAHGIYGPDLLEALGDVDDFVERINKGIASRHLENIVNLIVVSDHGMSPTSDERLVFLDDYLDMDLVDKQTAWPNAGLRLKDETKARRTRITLSREISKDQALVFDSSSGNMPEDWHFGSSDEFKYGYRVAPIYIVPHVGWTILTHDDYDKMDKTYDLKGVHGYRPDHPLMRAAFIAKGPNFKQGKAKPFSSVNIYPLLCKLLNIKAAKNSGEGALKTLEEAYHEKYPDVDFPVDYFNGSTFENF